MLNYALLIYENLPIDEAGIIRDRAGIIRDRASARGHTVHVNDHNIV